jgi:hypothetical protein
MTKVSDLDEDEREIIGDLLEVKAIELGFDKWESQSSRVGGLKDLIGICFNCQYMRYCKTEFGTVRAICWQFKINLQGEDKVIECNEHTARGTMSLRDMETIATLIDVDKSEIKGFISRDPKLRKEK